MRPGSRQLAIGLVLFAAGAIPTLISFTNDEGRGIQVFWGLMAIGGYNILIASRRLRGVADPDDFPITHWVLYAIGSLMVGFGVYGFRTSSITDALMLFLIAFGALLIAFGAMVHWRVLRAARASKQTLQTPSAPTSAGAGPAAAPSAETTTTATDTGGTPNDDVGSSWPPTWGPD